VTELVSSIVLLIKQYPQVKLIFDEVFKAYMKEMHKIDVKDFIEAERKGDVKEMQKIMGKLIG
jgi:hypothetical protein